jgi:RimJ/RimL family protein N-acetyltransferase
VSRQAQLTSSRLLLRRWRESDRAPFAALSDDPEVMRFMPSPPTRLHSDELIESFEAHAQRHGFAPWALELRASGELIGFTGLDVVSFPAAFTPAVEVSWRLGRAAWGHGYATEAARAALAYGFGELALEQIVAQTSTINERSRAVMRRLRMRHDPSDDFDHPRLGDDSPLLRHVLYRLSAAQWHEGDAGEAETGA